MTRVGVVGAGGHAKVVIDTLRASGVQPVIVYDVDVSKHGTCLLGVDVTTEMNDIAGLALVVAIGSNAAREHMVESLGDREYYTVLHTAATISSAALIGEGTVVFAGAIVQPSTCIGRHVIINTSATIDHDCCIGDYAHISPGVHLAGGVSVGRGAWVGIGAAVKQGVTIGDGATVGAGAAVIRDVEPYTTVAGVPAKVIRAHE